MLPFSERFVLGQEGRGSSPRLKPGASAATDFGEHPRLVQVRQSVLKRNDITARALRERFRQAGTYVVSLVSSPGAGKTEFLEKVLGQLRVADRVAAVVGDLATDNDARRLARSQAPVRQITTGTICHLEAEMVEAALEGWPLDELDFLCIENVGNLVCTSTFDLDEDLRLVLFSGTEGEDKPQKYPTIFHTADVAIITKTDLATAVGFDHQAAHRSIQSVRPGMEVFEVSAKTGSGMGQFLSVLRSRRTAARPVRETPQVAPVRRGSPDPAARPTEGLPRLRAFVFGLSLNRSSPRDSASRSIAPRRREIAGTCMGASCWCRSPLGSDIDRFPSLGNATRRFGSP